MKGVLKGLELVTKVITLVLGIGTFISIMESKKYKCELAKKAQDYLENEEVEEEYLGETIDVYSPQVSQHKEKITKLLIATIVSSIVALGLQLLNKKIED